MTETGQNLVAKVRELVAANPDFVYEPPTGGCAYYDGDEPSCLIGQALHALGLITPSKILDSGIGMNHKTCTYLFQQLKLGLSEYESAWLREVQLGQDGGTSWSECINEADRFYGSEI